MMDASLDENREAKISRISEFLAARTNWDFDALRACVTEDYVCVVAGDRRYCPICGSYYGKAGACDLARALDSHLELLSPLTPLFFIIEGDQAVFLLASEWRSRGGGQPFRFETFQHMTFSGDLIRRNILYLDTARIASFGNWGQSQR
jgi:ketosteroid isomerase-like protein